MLSFDNLFIERFKFINSGKFIEVRGDMSEILFCLKSKMDNLL